MTTDQTYYFATQYQLDVGDINPEAVSTFIAYFASQDCVPQTRGGFDLQFSNLNRLALLNADCGDCPPLLDYYCTDTSCEVPEDTCVTNCLSYWQPNLPSLCLEQ